MICELYTLKSEFISMRALYGVFAWAWGLMVRVIIAPYYKGDAAAVPNRYSRRGRLHSVLQIATRYPAPA